MLAQHKPLKYRTDPHATSLSLSLCSAKDEYVEAYGEDPVIGPPEQLDVVALDAPVAEGIIVQHREWSWQTALNMAVINELKSLKPEDPFLYPTTVTKLENFARGVYQRRNRMHVKKIKIPANLRTSVCHKAQKYRPRIQPNATSDRQIGDAGYQSVGDQHETLPKRLENDHATFEGY